MSSNLSNVSFPALTTISGHSTFDNCENLTTISLPALTTISGDSTFGHCNRLKTVSLPALTTISGRNTFKSCRNLTEELHFPKLQEIVGEQTFIDCDKFFSIYGDSSVDSYMRENYIFNPSDQKSTNDYIAEDFTYAKDFGRKFGRKTT